MTAHRSIIVFFIIEMLHYVVFDVVISWCAGNDSFSKMFKDELPMVIAKGLVSLVTSMLCMWNLQYKHVSLGTWWYFEGELMVGHVFCNSCGI